MGKKLLDIMREKMRFKHYSISTEKNYLHWLKQYICYIKQKTISLVPFQGHALLLFPAIK